MSSLGDPIGIVVPQSSGPARRVIGLFVVCQEACYVLAVPGKARSYLAKYEGRDYEGEPVLLCLIRVLFANTISDTSGWRRAFQFESCHTLRSVLQLYAAGQDPTDMRTDFIEYSKPAAPPAESYSREPIRRLTQGSAAEARQAWPESRQQCLWRRKQTHTSTEWRAP